jgi:hypothetical protein
MSSSHSDLARQSLIATMSSEKAWQAFFGAAHMWLAASHWINPRVWPVYRIQNAAFLPAQWQQGGKHGLVNMIILLPSLSLSFSVPV